MLEKLSKWIKRTAWCSLGLTIVAALTIVLYLAAALVGAVVPRNREFRASQQGVVTIWVSCGEIHSDIVVPASNQYFDWTEFLSRKELPQVDQRFGWIGMGWGDRRVYLETPTWAELKWKNVATAMVGIDPTAMHIQWIAGDLVAGPQCRAVGLDQTQYLQLCSYLRQGFSQDSGRPIRINAPGYGPHDLFYEAQGRYSVLNDCNTWAGDALASSGVRVGAWTPFPWGVLWQLETN